MSNRPVPTALKILHGNPGKRPINKEEPKPPSGTLTMPKWLKSFPIAVKEWKREAKILDEMGVLTLAEAGDLALRAYLSSEIQSLALDIREEGRTVEVTQLSREGEEVKTFSKPNPKCVQLKNILSEYRQLGSLLGLDPSSRSKLKSDKSKKQSKAEEFRSRKKG